MTFMVRLGRKQPTNPVKEILGSNGFGGTAPIAEIVKKLEASRTVQAKGASVVVSEKAIEAVVEATQVKRRGRPKGSKNKNSKPVPAKKRGRPSKAVVVPAVTKTPVVIVQPKEETIIVTPDVVAKPQTPVDEAAVRRYVESLTPTNSAVLPCIVQWPSGVRVQQKIDCRCPGSLICWTGTTVCQAEGSQFTRVAWDDGSSQYVAAANIEAFAKPKGKRRGRPRKDQPRISRS
jgi:hypothetical protein